MQKIVGVKRLNDKNIYYFVQNIDVEVGDKVIVNFDEFQTVATVAKPGAEIEDDKVSELKKLVRKATESDLKKFEQLQMKAKNALPEIKKKSLELGLMMKFISAEFSLDNSKIMIIFSSEERVDFRQFLKELAVMLKTRIELKQIGQRDEIKICGGVGPCGEPCCCARFLNDFEHVTVKMAKIQGLSLSPTKINGICGRLMCCLEYETSTYEEVLSRMPKVNTEVISPNGKGTVVYNDILRERVSVKREAEGGTFVVEDFALEEIKFKDKFSNKSNFGNVNENKTNPSKVSEDKSKDNVKSANKQNKENLTNQTETEDVKTSSNIKTESEFPNKQNKNNRNHKFKHKKPHTHQDK